MDGETLLLRPARGEKKALIENESGDPKGGEGRKKKKKTRGKKLVTHSPPSPHTRCSAGGGGLSLSGNPLLFGDRGGRDGGTSEREMERRTKNLLSLSNPQSRAAQSLIPT